MASCTGTTKAGDPCQAKAKAGTDPPRCARHPIDDTHKPAHLNKQAFLEAFALIGNVSDAATAAKIGRRTHYEWMDADPLYREAFADAREQAADRLEREAVRRATQGTPQGVWHKGEQVGTELRYSDVLLIFLLKAARPEKYRDNYHVQVDGRVEHTLAWEDSEGSIVAAAERRLAIDVESTEAEG